MTLSPVLLLLLAFAAFVLLAAFWRWLRRRARAIPRGRIIYSDADGAARPLYSPHRSLSGKPDYVVRLRDGSQVPIEYKSYRAGTRPPHPDLVQLGAYLVLLEDLTGKAPPYGVIRYRDRTLRVPYTDALRAEILQLLEGIARVGSAAPAGIPSLERCRHCPFAPICEDAAERE